VVFLWYTSSMEFILLFAFLFGLIIGSFLNVVVLRYGTKSANKKRSFCFSCGKTLRFFELIPVASFFIQKGRCRGCFSSISWQYPIVELLTGTVFASIVYHNLQPVYDYSATTYLLPLFASLSWWFVVGCQLLVWSFLIAIAVYDLRHKIIPNKLVYSASFVSFLLFLFSYFMFHTPSLLDFLGGPLLALPFALIWLFSRGRAMGLGDAKLILLFSWFIGFSGALSAVLIGFWMGAGVALFGIALKAVASITTQPTSVRAKRRHILFPGLRSVVRNLTMKSELPLAPFLIVGLFIVYVWGVDVTGLGVLLHL